MRKQVERQRSENKEAEKQSEARKRSEETEKILDSTDKLLDEIDALLEEQGLNEEVEAQQFVSGFIQAGGQ